MYDLPENNIIVNKVKYAHINAYPIYKPAKVNSEYNKTILLFSNRYYKRVNAGMGIFVNILALFSNFVAIYFMTG